MIRRVVLFLLAVLCLETTALAAELEDALDADQVTAAAPSSAREILGDTDAASADLDSGLERLKERAKVLLPDVLREAVRPLAAIVVICLLCGIGDSLSAVGKNGLDAVSMGGSLAVAVIGVSDVRSALTLGTDTLAELTDFSRVLLPTLTTAAAATGAPGSAAAAYAAAALFSDLLLSAAQTLILPAICAYTAVVVCSAVLGEKRLSGAAGLLERGTKLLMKALVISFTAYLSLSGILTGPADAAAVKAAKTVISATLPVVGKLMADASEALIAGAGAVRGAIGVYGLLICLAVILLPVLRLGLRCLMFRAAAALCTGFAGERQAQLISGLGNAYGMMLGLIATGAAVEFLAVIALIRTVTL